LKTLLHILLLSYLCISLDMKVFGQSAIRLDSLRNVMHKSETDTGKISSIIKIALEYYVAVPDSARKYANWGLRLSDSAGYPMGQSKCLNILGLIEMNYGSLAKAIEYQTKALIYAEQIDSKKIMASVYNNLGISYYLLNDYKKAQFYYFKALNLFEEQNDYSGQGSAFNNIGIIFDLQGNKDQAAYYYRKNLDLAIKENRFNDQIVGYLNIGTIFETQKKYTEAEVYYQRALALSDSLDVLDIKTTSLGNIGGLYVEMEKYTLAEKYLMEALDISLKMNSLLIAVDVYGSLSMMEMKLKNYQKAKIYLDKGLKIATEMNNRETLLEIYDISIKYYESIQDYKNSLKYFKLYKTEDDSIKTDENIKSLFQMQMEYQTQQKLKEEEITTLKQAAEKQSKLYRQRIFIAIVIVVFVLMVLLLLYFYKINNNKEKANKLLLQKNQQIYEQSEELMQILEQLSMREHQLTESNHAKDKMLSIIGHDLRGPVGSLERMLNYLVEEYEHFNNEEIHNLLEAARESAELTFNLLDNLLIWARNQQNDIAFSPTYYALLPVVIDNFNYLKGVAEIKSIKLISNVNDDIQGFFDKNMISTVMRNLISNAIKFTPGEGTIVVEAHNIPGNKLEVNVKDNGVGIAPENINKIFNISIHYTTLGTNHEKGSGLGLKLCKDFIEMHGGTIHVNSILGEGTTFTFTLPIEEYLN